MPRRSSRPVPLARASAAAVLGATVLIAACSTDRETSVGFRDVTDRPATSEVEVTTTSRPRPTTTPGTTNPRTTSTSSTSTSTTSTSTSTTTTTIDPLTVRHLFPIDLSVNASWTPEGHSTYRASDIFASSDCGTPLLAVVEGVIDDVMIDTYDRADDNPALRGGNAVSIIGVDGVRYYYAHFESIDPAIVPGATVTAGQLLGAMGTTGRSGACHLHFGISMPCADQPDDWWIRRGVIWPDQYLSAWRGGEMLSPLPELQAWFSEYPDACVSVEGTPYSVG